MTHETDNTTTLTFTNNNQTHTSYPTIEEIARGLQRLLEKHCTDLHNTPVAINVGDRQTATMLNKNSGPAHLTQTLFPLFDFIQEQAFNIRFVSPTFTARGLLYDTICTPPLFLLNQKVLH